jgi:NADH:ubiquinone oxidoreductase subunit E
MSYTPSAAVSERIDQAVAAYPEPSAALLPVLRLIQEETGWIPPDAERWAASRLGLAPVRVREVVTFYGLLRRRPAGRTVVQVCRNLSCTLAGAEEVIAALRRELGLGEGAETTTDGAVTLVTVECLGHCDHGPCLQIDGRDHGPVTAESAGAMVREIRGQ